MTEDYCPHYCSMSKPLDESAPSNEVKMECSLALPFHEHRISSLNPIFTNRRARDTKSLGKSSACHTIVHLEHVSIKYSPVSGPAPSSQGSSTPEIFRKPQDSSSQRSLTRNKSPVVEEYSRVDHNALRYVRSSVTIFTQSQLALLEYSKIPMVIPTNKQNASPHEAPVEYVGDET